MLGFRASRRATGAGFVDPPLHLLILLHLTLVRLPDRVPRPHHEEPEDPNRNVVNLPSLARQHEGPDRRKRWPMRPRQVEGVERPLAWLPIGWPPHRPS